MVFFAGGVEQQAGRILKEGAGRCFRCGGAADLVETDKVLKLFFLPVHRWPSGEALRCDACSLLFPSSLPLPPPPSACPSCAREVVDPSFRFCPFCGSSL